MNFTLQVHLHNQQHSSEQNKHIYFQSIEVIHSSLTPGNINTYYGVRFRLLAIESECHWYVAVISTAIVAVVG